MKIYELRKSVFLFDEWHVGGPWGQFYATLEGAQAQVAGAEWKKRERQRGWDDSQKNIIIEHKVVQ